MISILISAIGTGAGWNLATTIKDLFSKDIRLVGCDINPRHLVAASNFVDTYYQVTPINNPNHKDELRTILQKEKIDYFIPIIDDEIYQFPCDDPWLTSHRIQALTAPTVSVQVLSNKKTLYQFLQMNGIEVPQVIDEKNVIDPNKQYFVKPINGHGSLGATTIEGRNALRKLGDSTLVIQELCAGPEITVDVFLSNESISSICRERIETKSGVCTKAKVWHDTALHQLATLITQLILMPPMFCFQVMRNQKQKFCVTDINPRLGAGTSMGSVCGWNGCAALLSTLSGIGNPSQYLNFPKQPTYVTRVYQDIRMEE